ncbi:MAG: HAD family hydrolase [Candidatus Aenigmatarchaeota archaeon]|nr:MAG: HAD family hydrolase [Candidatus Aenigmarchaeota archaeon]
MFKLVIFDLDGTLIDSMEAIVRSMNVTFSELGLGPYEWGRDVQRFFGKPFQKWAETLLKEGGKYSKKNMERMTNRMWDNYADIGVKYTKLKEGAIEVLETLRKRGVRLAVATNMIARHANIFFSHFDLRKYFEKVCTVSDVEKGKPHPDQVECILEDLDAERDETLIVGDTISDLHFAKNSGIRIAIIDAPWNRSLRPDYRIKKLKELLEIV